MGQGESECIGGVILRGDEMFGIGKLKRDVEWLISEEARREAQAFKEDEKKRNDAFDTKAKTGHAVCLLNDILATPGLLTKKGKEDVKERRDGMIERWKVAAHSIHLYNTRGWRNAKI